MMTLGRFLGDAVSTKMGSVKIVALGAFVAIVGYGLVLTTATTLAIVGFALCGLGFSVMVPELFRIGGNVKGVESSQGVSFIAGMGYSGFLLAPPLLGYVAKTSSLVSCFVIMLFCAILVLGATYFLNRKRI
jgi:fucose permease